MKFIYFYSVFLTSLFSYVLAVEERNQYSPASPPSSLGVFVPHQIRGNQGLWVDAELLFWQSNLGGLDYAIESQSTTKLDHGKVKQPDFHWDLGARVGLGYRLPHDRWDVLVRYTYLHAEGSGSAHRENGAIFPIWATSVSGVEEFFASSAKAHWNAGINLADLELGRTCLVGKWLSIRPFIGVRGLVIDQDYHVSYEGGSGFPGVQDRVKMSSDEWGVGLRMGLNSLWGLGKGIGIYGDGSFSLLSGNFDVHEKESIKEERRLNVHRDVNNLVVAADLALGLQWDYLFSKDRYHFGVKFGWEFNIFFDQNQLFNFSSVTTPGSVRFKQEDLSFQGVTLGFRFDF